ncbi:MAG: transcriptional regulator [Methylotenera sp.]|nr:BolA family transcriptional regulator [Methylotenera sp.]PPC85209.1 MAG: transcriptional regulator [Methylotenera sp.]
MNLNETIQARLAQLNPISLALRDDSALHAGHAGNTGGGHFHLTIVSSQFSQKSQIMRHRLIYQALTDLMPQQIHAISILAISPDDPN